jgi:hypothetical protein
LSVIPLAVGALRLLQLAGGPALVPSDHRFAGFPGALVAHIVGAAVFALVGAFSAVWLTLFYQQQPGSGTLLFFLRLVFAPAMAACLVLGFTAIHRRDIPAHRAWMMRAYAIGLAAGTQAFTEGIGEGIFGHGVLVADLSKGAGWVIDLAIAEWLIRRSPRRRTRPASQARRRHATV